MLQEQLREWRKRNKYTQAMAAAILHVTIGHYRKWEYGASPIPYIVGDFINLLDKMAKKSLTTF